MPHRGQKVIKRPETYPEVYYASNDLQCDEGHAVLAEMDAHLDVSRIMHMYALLYIVHYHCLSLFYL